MNNILDEPEKQKIFSDLDLFTTIWVKPKSIFHYIHEAQYDKYVTILLMLAGISKAFDRAVMKDMGDQYSLVAIIIFCLVIGGTIGTLSYYLYAVLLSWTGKWLEGEADNTAILRILAYAMIPACFSLILLIPQLMLYGIDLFQAYGNTVSDNWFVNIVFFGLSILEFILGLYSIVLCVIGLAVVQNFSIGKAIINILLPVLVILLPILIIVVIFSG